jgi:hypothetical protein
MPREDPVQIPLDEEEALKLLLQVKPTEDMPGPGANPTTKKIRRRLAGKKSGRKE